MKKDLNNDTMERDEVKPRALAVADEKKTETEIEIEIEKPKIDLEIPIIEKRKKMVALLKEDGTIGECEIEIPDDQPDILPTISPEEIQNNQPIIRREFVSVLNKTFNDINESIAKINELETKIKSLENIIIEHNELLKKIVNIISK